MKREILILVLASIWLTCSTGCVGTYMLQLEKKMPKIDADELYVKGHTIYGVSGEITQTNVRWEGDVKKIGSLHVRVDSPIGGFEVRGKNGKISP